MRRKTENMTKRRREIIEPDHFDLTEIGINSWIIRHWNEDGTLHHMSPDMSEKVAWDIASSLTRAGHRYKKHPPDPRVAEGREIWAETQPERPVYRRDAKRNGDFDE